MIQRIQSIFLLLTTILMAVSIFSPLVELSRVCDISLTMYACGIADKYHTWGVLTFAILSTVFALVSIFMYKNRKRQINLCFITALFIVIYYVAAIVYLMVFLNRMENTYHYQIQLGIALPFIALIFDLLAISRIKKDEKLVKSLDRIR